MKEEEEETCDEREETMVVAPPDQKMTSRPLRHCQGNVLYSLEDARKHLERVDPQFKTLIERYGLPKFELTKNICISLVRSVVNQQLSTKASKAIFKRFLSLVASSEEADPDSIHPNDILKHSEEVLQTAGLSKRKASYVRNIAQ